MNVLYRQNNSQTNKKHITVYYKIYLAGSQSLNLELENNFKEFLLLLSFIIVT